jgi:hypothetical protein
MTNSLVGVVFRCQLLSKILWLSNIWLFIWKFLLLCDDTLYTRFLNCIENVMLVVGKCDKNIYYNVFRATDSSFFRFVKKLAIYRLGIISIAHVPVHVTDFPVVNVRVDELSSAQIWHMFIFLYFWYIVYLRNNVFWVLIWVGGY